MVTEQGERNPEELDLTYGGRESTEKGFLLKQFDNCEEWRRQAGDYCNLAIIYNKPRRWDYDPDYSQRGPEVFDIERLAVWSNRETPAIDSVFMIGSRRISRKPSKSDPLDFLYSFKSPNPRIKLLKPSHLIHYFKDEEHLGYGRLEFNNTYKGMRFIVDSGFDKPFFGGEYLSLWSAPKILSRQGLEECFKLVQVVGNAVHRTGLQPLLKD